MDLLMEHVGKGFITMLLISMPVVLTAAGIGLVVGILQAVTQIQEQTIAAAPKIVGVFLVLMVLGGFFLNILEEYLKESANLAFNVITKEGDFVLPSASGDKDYSGLNKPSYGDLMKNPAKSAFGPHRYKPTYTPAPKAPTPSPNFVESRKLYTGR